MVGLAGHVCHKQDYELLVHGCHAGNLASSWHHPCKLASLSIILSLFYQTLPKSSVQCLHKDLRICPLLHFFLYKGVTPSLLGVCFDAFVHCLLSTYFDIQLVFNVVSLGVTMQWQISAGTQHKGYNSLPAEAHTLTYSPKADRSSNKQPMERKSPSLQAKSATTIDVSPKSLENLLDTAKVFTLDTPSKHTVKLGHDHTLLQAATTQDYW
jgi:hypothetical protein